MRIAYILSTYEKHIGTVVHFQLYNFAKYININDVYYVSSKMDLDKRVYGWDTIDNSDNIIYKYINFFKNAKLDYDWYFFGHDTSYVFHTRLQALLEKYDSSKNYYIGKILDHVQSDFCLYMSGGAGYVISRKLYHHIVDYVMNHPVEVLFKHWCNDLCLGLWIAEINKTHTIINVDDDRFNSDMHHNVDKMSKAITFNGLYKKDYAIYDRYVNTEDTTVVLVTDIHYYNRALKTIQDVRNIGKWNGMIQLITLDFDMPPNDYDIVELKFPKIDTSQLLQHIGDGFSNSDGRELSKIYQWEKFHVFDEHFKQWKRVIFMDAGLRVFDRIDYLLDLDYKGKFLCPTDQGRDDTVSQFRSQISNDNTEIVNRLVKDYGNILDSSFFLNCIWVYDTKLLNNIHKQEFVDVMNQYPLFKTNEMGVMNIILNFKMNYWEPFPRKATNGKYLFDWSDYNRPGTKCNQYCFIKYPSIGLNDLNPS